jgi:Asp/Glu/hydantoin racemase
MRVALLHTGAIVIPAFTTLAKDYLPGIEVQHLLDDKIIADLGGGASAETIAARLSALGQAAKAAGAQAVVFTCSSISGYAGQVADKIQLPVYRIDEAMADKAVAVGRPIAVIATLRTTLEPTAALLQERARHAGRAVDLTTEVVQDAFEATVAGNTAEHDRLVRDAIQRHAADGATIVLAQASMATAAEGLTLDVPVLTSPELGIQRLLQEIKES